MVSREHLQEEAAESPVTAEELAEAFTGEELAFICDTFADTVQGSYAIQEDELPANCIHIRCRIAVPFYFF